MKIDNQTRIRLARPSLDLSAAERFYVDGLGLSVLYRHEAETPDEFSLLMLGFPGAVWHLELTHSASHAVRPSPTEDDLLVLYLGEPVSAETLAHLQACGGVQVPALNPYWDKWGVTLQDPDGYRVVLCVRDWAVYPPLSPQATSHTLQACCPRQLRPFLAQPGQQVRVGLTMTGGVAGGRHTGVQRQSQMLAQQPRLQMLGAD